MALRMPSRLLPILLAAALAAAATPGRAAGQDPDSARAVLRRDGVCPGAQVQVSTTFGERFSGTCVLQDARLLLVLDGVEQPVLYTAVDSIWVRGPATRAGTITGAWVGAGVGGALGAAFIGVFCDYACRDDLTVYAVGGAAAGALGGTVVGTVVGSEMRVWIRLYPHR